MQPMNTVQIAHFPPITVDEIRAAGIVYHPQTGLGPMPSWIPVTQEDRDHLGVVRNRKLEQLQVMAFASIILSCVCIAVGVAAILTSAPNYMFPHSLGGGIIIGVMVLLYCMLIICLVREGRKTPTGDTTTSCFGCITTCNFVFPSFMITFCLVAVGMSGIWAVIDCAERTPEDDTASFTSNGCTPRTDILYALAILTLVIGSILLILFLTMNCMICCNYRAFGVKSNYEMFSDYQIARMQQMNMQMQPMQTQQPLPQQGQGQFPVQGQYQQQGSYQQSPTAPMLPQNYGFPQERSTDGYTYSSSAAREGDDLPSYNEVVQSGKYG